MKPTLTYHIPATLQNTEVFVGSGLLAKLPELLKEKVPAYRYALITDSTVEILYGKALLTKLRNAGLTVDLFSFPAGEISKNEATKQKLDHALLEKNFGRDTVILALGGGVVGDLAGFVAATYLRGVPYVQIPTTVLAMVDSSIGGKVGVDTVFGKNLLGAFWHPRMIVADLDTLETLSEKEKTNGWFEALKMFFTMDAEAYEKAKFGFDASLLERAMQLKMQVVEADEREAGLRAILNFGHSVGHALEILSHYKIPHGYAVALGMLVEARLTETSRDLESVLLKLGVEPSQLKNFPAKEVWEAMQNDKKNRAGEVRILNPVTQKLVVISWETFSVIYSSMEKTPMYYAGTVGSFSERAAKQFMERKGLNPDEVELSPTIDPPQTLEAWRNNPRAFATVPVWSDVLGPIPTARTKMIELGWPRPEDTDPDWMSAFAALHSSVKDQLALPVHFDLLTVPGVSKDQITQIAAYTVAEVQCLKGIARVLGDKFKGIKIVGYPDSALAAKDLAALAKDPKAEVSLPGVLDPSCTAVLALPSSASQFGLVSAWAGVQDKPDGNATHFVLLAH